MGTENFDQNEYNTTVAAYSAIGAIGASASAVVFWIYYTTVATGKYKEAKSYIQIINSILQLYPPNHLRLELQNNYLNTATRQLTDTWGNWFNLVIFRYTAKQVDKVLNSIKRQAVDSARQYITDIDIIMPSNDDAIINLARTYVNKRQIPQNP